MSWDKANEPAREKFVHEHGAAAMEVMDALWDALNPHGDHMGTPEGAAMVVVKLTAFVDRLATMRVREEIRLAGGRPGRAYLEQRDTRMFEAEMIITHFVNVHRGEGLGLSPETQKHLVERACRWLSAPLLDGLAPGGGAGTKKGPSDSSRSDHPAPVDGEGS